MTKPTDKELHQALPATPDQLAKKFGCSALDLLCRLQNFQRHGYSKELRPAGDVGPTIYNTWQARTPKGSA